MDVLNALIGIDYLTQEVGLSRRDESAKITFFDGMDINKAFDKINLESVHELNNTCLRLYGYIGLEAR